MKEKLKAILARNVLWDDALIESIATILVDNGVMVLDDKTALAIGAGAYAIAKRSHMDRLEFVQGALSDSPKSIPYTEACRILADISEKYRVKAERNNL